jgi:hypothetical protein
MNWTYNTGLNGVVQIVLCECDVHPTASVYRVTLLVSNSETLWNKCDI